MVCVRLIVFEFNIRFMLFVLCFVVRIFKVVRRNCVIGKVFKDRLLWKLFGVVLGFVLVFLKVLLV